MIDRMTIQDGDGFYYWHITSGTIQREPPHRDREQSNIVRLVLGTPGEEQVPDLSLQSVGLNYYATVVSKVRFFCQNIKLWDCCLIRCGYIYI